MNRPVIAVLKTRISVPLDIILPIGLVLVTNYSGDRLYFGPIGRIPSRALQLEA